MSNYNPQRSRNLFTKGQKKPFKLSRTKIQAFLDCPRCFYLDRRCGTGQPPGFPFTLNNAVDTLLKKEFDACRAKGEAHPIMKKFGVDGVPFQHPDLEKWQDALHGGVQHVHETTNLLITGAPDDIWVTPEGELIVVDYKATSTAKEVTLENRQSYKNQMDLYQWLLRKNGFRVSNRGYFVYCNGDAGREAFGQQLNFEIILLPYEGDDSWVEETLVKIKACLEQDVMPAPMEDCEFCGYWHAVRRHTEMNSSRNQGE